MGWRIEKERSSMFLLRSLRRHANLKPHERFQRAIEDIDKEFKRSGREGLPFPLDLYRTRLILEQSLQRCGFACAGTGRPIRS